MIPRAISSNVVDSNWGRQMRFIVGPRQCGKTTLAKAVLTESGSYPKLYFDWDDRAVRLRYQSDPGFLSQELSSFRSSKILPWVTFDEIHKYPKWKDVLKGIFDKHEPRLRLLVTGSARLDLLRRAGDSLAGRYFTFHLFPFTLREVTGPQKISVTKPPESAETFLEERFSKERFHQSEVMRLLEAGGFPEPFLKNSGTFQKKWHTDFIDRLIRGDLRDLTRIEKLEHVAYLLRLLAERVGSPLSINSLREILEDSYNAVRNYIRALRLTYVLFELSPYTKRISRGLSKATKTYLFDWTHIGEEAQRFENYVACELNTWVHSWTDAGFGKYELRYVRRRDGRETDFLILREESPWFLVEAKLTDQPISNHHYDHANALGGIPIVQVVLENKIARAGNLKDYRISASRFFA